MRRSIAVGLAIALCGAAPGRPARSDAKSDLRLGRTISLPGVLGSESSGALRGRFDHLAHDPKTDRLFVAAVAHGSLEVVDLASGARVKSIPGLPSPTGVALSDDGVVVVACGGDGTVRAFDARTLEPIGRAVVGEDADNVRFVRKRFYVAYGSDAAGGIAFLDGISLSRVGELPLPAHPEAFQLTPDAARIFVNVPGGKSATEEGRVIVGDVAAAKVLATWTLAKTSRNFPMALDVPRGRVYVAARGPAKLLCLDAESGRVVSEAPCVADADDLFLDGPGRLYVIGGGEREPKPTDGAIETFSVGTRGELVRVASVPTPHLTRTGLLVPSRRAIYVAVPYREDHPAELREYLLPE